MSPSPSREAALRALLDIETCRHTLKAALSGVADFPGVNGPLDRRDRALCLELVAGVLRNRALIDWFLSGFLKKPIHETPAPVVEALRLGAYQILFMDRIPVHSAVNESVELVKVHAGSRHSGLVNAVLRNLDRRRDDLTPPDPETNPLTYMTVTLSHPEWLVQRWVKRWGEDRSIQLCQANHVRPPLTLRVNSRRMTREHFLEQLESAGLQGTPSPVAPHAIRLNDETSLSDIPDSLWPLFQVQDEAAQLLAPLLDVKPGQRVLDACAAPGGKATHIAELMDDRGDILAVDKNAARAARIAENAGRLGLSSIRVYVADLLAPQNPGRFDRILLDAPCSGLGVLRRNPDIKWCRRERDLARDQDIQMSLLERTSLLLEPGGRILYSVCSFEPEEGPDVVEAFARKTGFRIEDISRHPLDAPYFMTLPHRDGIDGFFAARLAPPDPA